MSGRISPTQRWTSMSAYCGNCRKRLIEADVDPSWLHTPVRCPKGVDHHARIVKDPSGERWLEIFNPFPVAHLSSQDSGTYTVRTLRFGFANEHEIGMTRIARHPDHRDDSSDFRYDVDYGVSAQTTQTAPVRG